MRPKVEIKAKIWNLRQELHVVERDLKDANESENFEEIMVFASKAVAIHAIIQALEWTLEIVDHIQVEGV